MRLRAAPNWHDEIPTWGDRRAIRVGLLGGSFNPAHAGHVHVARVAMRRLRLDQLWLLVSPGNPLKPSLDMAALAERLRGAGVLADGARVIATDIERRLGTRFTWDTLRKLRIRFPRARFIWIMGADNLEQFPRWRRWMAIARETQIAVLPRPTYNHRALAGQAARRLRRWRVPVRQAPAMACADRPAWVFLAARENGLSATALRQLNRQFSGGAP